MLINKMVFHSMFKEVAELWEENIQRLTDIDSRFGDGDHGVTIGKMSKLILNELHNWKDESIADFIKTLEREILNVSGGSAGPLYGTMIGGLAKPLTNEEEIDASLLKGMFSGSLSELQELTKATVGDKTMMDALIPAVKAAKSTEGTPLEILKAASDAAEKGLRDTENMVSKFGRARSYGDKTLGTEDAGAASTSLFFQGLYKGALKEFKTEL
ncbi:dihydroxyacetone kinase subunit L [Anaerosphaera multitolerans]|uniref:phosphoenolpyruvate--glycerone phosphotransferase n=1 Tax=Anaerosphaera multitolerans TaxID=2487351 RepID=A0A437S7R4_9FIRM|nr:dihydroxyacetone kinase subunit L [Anaerosphaera multitolerans]RVU55022.1 dihydroxyacetone kinase subunit L [Anaerosphaera multitolerans]